MDISEYRKQVQEQIDRVAGDAEKVQGALRTASTSGGDAIQLFLNPQADPQQRVAALNLATIEISKRQDLLALVMSMLRDTAVPPRVKRAALSVLRTASFRAATFAPMRADYLDALRSLVEDSDSDLRTQAIEILAQEKDEYVQRRLLEGLQNPAAALAPPELAIEFLGYDLHAEHLPLVRDLARSAASPQVKQQAVRLLSADAASMDLLKDTFNDRNEDVQVRTAAAAALQTLAPAEFARAASALVLDESEDSRMRAASVSALDHVNVPGSAAEQPDFIERVQQLQSLASGELKEAAQRFTDRRNR